MEMRDPLIDDGDPMEFLETAIYKQAKVIEGWPTNQIHKLENNCIRKESQLSTTWTRSTRN